MTGYHTTASRQVIQDSRAYRTAQRLQQPRGTYEFEVLQHGPILGDGEYLHRPPTERGLVERRKQELMQPLAMRHATLVGVAGLTSNTTWQSSDRH